MIGIMTREEQILNKSIDYSEIEENFLEYDDCGDVCDDKYFVEKAFIEGAKWADENPDSKHTYTKQQLMDMGVAFTTNGDIVTPNQLNEDLKKFFKYKKRKFIEKTCQWLKTHIKLETASYADLWDQSDIDLLVADFTTVDEMEESFRKIMEE